MVVPYASTRGGACEKMNSCIQTNMLTECINSTIIKLFKHMHYHVIVAKHKQSYFMNILTNSLYKIVLTEVV